MNQTRALIEGAIMASVYAVLFLITLYIPLLSIVSTFFLSIPFTLYTIRNGLKKSYLLVAVAIVLSVLLGSIATIFIPILYGAVGVVLGYLIKKKKSAFALLLGATLAYISNLLLTYIISIMLLDVNIVDGVLKQINELISNTERIGKTFGTDVSEAIDQLQNLLEVITYIIPALIVLVAVFSAFISIFVTNLILKRFKIEVPDWRPFREWSFPKSIIWYYLATMLIMFTDPEQGSGLYIATVNLYMILETVMVIQGFSFIYFYFWVKKKGKTIPVLVTIGAFLVPIGFYVVRILGIIDIGFDLKKRIKA
ncbi:YybS family protein [Alkalihalobacillus sp. AL-G]|uniref:YybS family protein n=1 Tax=Alkalihalobacillus sp. AL-G TaxID=2926399 RepID=UPI00272B8742|nr:YybS family protein [Alkalihalobacillus sp. AL-G]WLD93374.1 YybS family protein [Alkalihalobacillus sp. AL-G]